MRLIKGFQLNALFTFDANVNRKTITNTNGPLLRKDTSKRHGNVNAPKGGLEQGNGATECSASTSLEGRALKLEMI